MAKIVEYFVVPQSPWTYLGHQRFTAIVKKHHAQVVLKPADMVKVFAASGTYRWHNALCSVRRIVLPSWHGGANF